MGVSGPGPFGFLCTGGLALATMTGGRATAGMASRKGGEEGGGYRADEMR